MIAKKTNSNFFKKKRPSTPPYKWIETYTITSVLATDTGYHPVVLVREEHSKVHTPYVFEELPTKLEALQKSHYINANQIMRVGDRLPSHVLKAQATLAELKELGYEL